MRSLFKFIFPIQLCLTNNYFYLLSMHPKTKTQISSNQLEKMILYAADEKLLPKLIWTFSKAHHSNALLKKYNQSINKIYTKETATPLKYNSEEAKSDLEKFREKVKKLNAHELQIDYLKPLKINEQKVMTYQSHPLQQVQYPTKKQFNMFRDFSETKFKKSFVDVFDDKLEYQPKSMFTQPKAYSKPKATKRPSAARDSSNIRNSALMTQPSTHNKELSASKNKDTVLPKLVLKTEFKERNRMHTSSNALRQKKVKKIIKINEEESIIQRIRIIGGYPKKIPIQSLSLTKESISKYLKEAYQRPSRLIQFLNIADVQTSDSFIKLSKRLKLMMNQHIQFMTFLFYDNNNDGYLCNQDLMNIEEISKSCPLIGLDCSILRKNAHKIKYEDSLDYKELYKVPELTETKYFNWRNKRSSNPEQQSEFDEQGQLKKYFGQMNRKATQIHFQGFKKIFYNEKPNLYYDLLWRMTGIRYEGMAYD